MRCRLLSILLASSLLATVSAQDYDRYLLSQQDIAGTARYVGLSGAFTALGGDVSAIDDNPAALGLFQHREISFTLDDQYSRSYSSAAPLATNTATLPQFSWVFGTGYDDKQSGLLRHNFVLQYHRLRSYNRSYNAAVTSPLSQTDLIASLTNGLPSSSFASGDDVWDDANIGWLSVMGYDCGIIKPDTTNLDNNWYSILEANEQVLSSTKVKETGSANQFTFAYGANISHRFYFGLSLNVLSLTHKKTVAYTEAFDKGGGYSYTTSVSTTGTGGNLALGLIYRPLSFFRLGASFQSPTVSYLRVDNLVQYNGVASSTYSTSIDRYMMPMRATFGAAFQFSTRGLISMEYDLRCRLRNYLPYEHTLKIGAEGVIHNNWFLRTGYAYRSSFATTNFSFTPANTDTRTDTEFFNPRGTHCASIGFGYRSNRWYIDLAYQFRLEQLDFYAHVLQSTPNAVDIASHRLILTVAFTR